MLIKYDSIPIQMDTAIYFEIYIVKPMEKQRHRYLKYLSGVLNVLKTVVILCHIHRYSLGIISEDRGFLLYE